MTVELQAMQISAPAKINLSLKVLGRRPNGFHEIETWMAPISLQDLIVLEKIGRPGLDFRCGDSSIPSGQENLVVRAAGAFFEATGLKPNVLIELQKQIPHGAGLGGGSSDAAATLLALNELFETNLPPEALAKLGSTVGSDVPFFIFKSAALCRGRGELVTPQPLAEPLAILLLKPDFAVSTAAAYSRWRDSREIPGIAYAPQEFHGYRLVNDLERPVFEKYVFLAELKTWLLKQPEVAAALLSGSGSTVLAVLKEARSADALGQRAREELDPKLWLCVAETL